MFVYRLWLQLLFHINDVFLARWNYFFTDKPGESIHPVWKISSTNQKRFLLLLCKSTVCKRKLQLQVCREVYWGRAHEYQPSVGIDIFDIVILEALRYNGMDSWRNARWYIKIISEKRVFFLRCELICKMVFLSYLSREVLKIKKQSSSCSLRQTPIKN